ncbi:MAG TPA: 4-alpha-glucanotransferase, partial [Spirochaetia bacterium]|nr:4-alpha-glucanotransferase [Spirochaetia bacterium]
MKLSIETRKSGVVVPLGALRTARSGGVGEYPDLPVLGELCERCGLSFVQLLPVNDTGFQSSPYSALSAFALHPLYLRLADLPEAAAFRAEAESLASRFGGRKRFPYPEILSAKLALLRRIFDTALPAIRKDPALAAWIGANPWVRDYAVFLGLKEEHGGMNESLADLFAITGDAKFLTTAKRFSHKAVLDPLVAHRDELTGKHANTQIPKVVGLERIATL